MSVNIKIENAQKRYGDNIIIENLSLDIKQGEFFTLLGPSGCGKTTLLRMIAGFNSIEHGNFYFNEKRINDLDPAKRNIGMVFQNYAIFPHLTVEQNVEFGLKNRKISKEEMKTETEKFLKLMQIDEYRDRMPERLSGGQQQRVALGRALVAQPEILLLDEPLSNLDAKLREEMRYEIKEITKKLKITVIYVTHDQIEAMTMSDRIVLINKGEVQQVAPPQEIYSKPKNMFVANFVGKVDFIKGKVEGNKILLDNSNGQTLSNTSSFKGDVVVAIRPENAILSDDGEITGKVYSKFYLGDCNDLRVEIGNGNILRIIARASTYNTLNEGDEVKIKILDYFIFEDDGKDQIKIMT